MSDDLNIKPGDRFIVKNIDGTEYTDRIHSIRYLSAEPEIRQRPTGWRRVLRNLTPRRWRKPLEIVRPYKPETIEVTGKSEYWKRAMQANRDITASINRLLRDD